MKSFLVIGLGRFGTALALNLSDQGNEVLGMDIRPERVQACADLITQAVIGDARDPEVLRALGAGSFDCAVVAFSNNVGDSALITLNLKELHLPMVVAKASSDVHRKVLEKIGADQVVFPGQEMALRLAQRLDNGDILNYIELSDEYSMMERLMPAGWADSTLAQLNIRANYQLSIIAVRRGEEMVISPGGGFALREGDCLVVLGRNSDIQRLEQI